MKPKSWPHLVGKTKEKPKLIIEIQNPRIKVESLSLDSFITRFTYCFLIFIKDAEIITLLYLIDD